MLVGVGLVVLALAVGVVYLSRIGTALQRAAEDRAEEGQAWFGAAAPLINVALLWWWAHRPARGRGPGSPDPVSRTNH